VIVFAAIAPHGDPAFVEGSPTNDAMRELGRRHAAATPDATVVLTPHGVHVQGSFAVVVAGEIAGRIDELEIELRRTIDRVLAEELLAALASDGIPAVGISYGSNDPELAEMPLDWGTQIPLEFMRGDEPLVVVNPSRDRPLDEHVRVGEILAGVGSERRLAVIASADQGHRHNPDGPFGFHPAAAEYDDAVVEIVRAGDLRKVLELEPVVEDAYADSLWQLAILAGALGESFDVELLSYEAPTYFGMLCAAFSR
jgi:aromatic ring-opening dioxygenase LigB subunit